MPVVVSNFCCPIQHCGHDQYDPIYEDPNPPQDSSFDLNTLVGPGNGPTSTTDTEVIVGYRCPKCTVRFDDPAKFSSNQPAEILPPVATSKPNPWDKSKSNKGTAVENKTADELLSEL
ncbi:MAG: hypothetical protein WEC81_00250 [Patescibacteria group bacterium]